MDIAGNSTVSTNFAGHPWGSAITPSGNTYVLSNTVTNDGDATPNDVGLVLQPSNNYFVSATWAGDANGTVVTDPVLTDNQTAKFGTNAFATIQDALNAAATAASSITAFIVNPGSYGDTTVGLAANIVLQGTALPTAISIASLTDTGFVNASVTIPAGTTLTVNGDGTPTSYVGSILGGGSFIKAGAGNFTVNQINVLSGPVEVSGGTFCNWATATRSAPSAAARSPSTPPAP